MDEYFPDFQNFSAKFVHLHTINFFTADPLHPFMYPATTAMAYAIFFRSSPQHALRHYLLFMFLCLLASGLLLTRELVRLGLNRLSASALVCATALLSYPIWFVIYQGNIEFVVWVIISIGLVAFFKQRPYVAGICFGTAASMKLFPFVYLGLLLAKKQYRAILISVAFAVAITIASLWVVYPDLRVSWHETQAGLENFRQVYMLHLRPERGFDHSLFGTFKRLQPTLPPPAQLEHVLSLYLLTASVAGLLLFFLRIRKLPVTNQVLCLTIASILLPPTSFDYTLIHLYAPWVLLVFYVVARKQQKIAIKPFSALGLIFLCFAVLFAPLTEIIYRGETVSGSIRSIVLTVLFALALIVPIPYLGFESHAQVHQKLGSS